MIRVRVQPYMRRSRGGYLSRHPIPSLAPDLQTVIDDVKEGHRSGYTWTLGWKFDVNEPLSMEPVYDKLGDRTMYAIATTNRTLEDWEGPEQFSVPISHNQGVGIWRSDDGTVYVDNVVMLFGPKVSEQWALDYAARNRQQSVLKVDGRTRTHSFLAVP